jgi:DNA repair exonuclease SbcCD ATPase subunit
MLTSLHITNFQSHKESHLEFDPGVNVIIGESDSGKTAILRALRWVLTNRPGGDSFRSSWGGDTSIGIWTENALIIREKIGTNNIYRLNDDTFKAFGTEVPEEIQDALNMNEINVQNQLDLPFLLRDSPGQVAAHFNKIAHLDAIDKSMQLIEKWTRALNQQLKDGESNLIQQQESLTEYSYLPEMEKAIEDAEWVEKQQIETSRKLVKLSALINSIDKVESKIEKHQHFLSFEKPVENAMNLRQEIIIKSESIRRLELLIRNISKKEKQIQESNLILQLEPDVIQALSQMSELRRKQVDLRNFKKLIDNEQIKWGRIQELKARIANQEKKFHSKLGAVCPLCGQGIK